MKKRTLFACGLAAALFAGCSSDDVTVDNGNITNGGSGFLALNISLPSTNGGSRANNYSNEQFEQGTSNEYSISDISLICYNASGEAVQSFTYTDPLAWSTKPASPSGITTDAVLKVQPVNNTVAKILVLVNAQDILTIGDNGVLTYHGIQYNKCTDNGTIKNNDGSQTLELQGEDLTGAGSKFFMSNAPLSNNTSTTVLVNVDPKPSEAAAQADIRTVNVERACSKVAVTCADSWSGNTFTLVAPGYVDDKVTFNEWLLDIKNNKEYPVRIYNKAWETLPGLSTQRFRGKDSDTKYTGNDGGEFYRTYWGEDPNYSSYIAGDFTQVTESEFNGTHSLGTNAPQYCNENTFNTNNMTQNQTTRVVLQASYVPNTSNGFTANTAISASDDSDTGTWYQLGNSHKPYNVDMINSLINGIDGCSGITLKRKDLNAGAKQTFTIAMFENYPPSADDVAKKQALVNKIINVLGNITVYKKGLCYYVVRIKHFGETYTLWTAGDNYVGSDLTNEDAKYLGRYGVLRNNSYQLELNSVTAPGTPTIPTATPSSDDEQNTYIQANVKIMDWAVRKQSVNL